MVNEFCIGLKNARKKEGLSLTDLSELTGISKSTLSDWELGKSQPGANALTKLCKALNVSIMRLIYGHEELPNEYFENLIKIPILGSIPAGTAIEAVEDILGSVSIQKDKAINGQYFALKVKGDSMSPTIKNGDIVIIKQADNCESGNICVVMINGYDATLKEIKKEEQGVWILPHNPNSDFKPTFYSNKEIESIPIRIIGIAVEIRRGL